ARAECRLRAVHVLARAALRHALLPGPHRRLAAQRAAAPAGGRILPALGHAGHLREPLPARAARGRADLRGRHARAPAAPARAAGARVRALVRRAHLRRRDRRSQLAAHRLDLRPGEHLAARGRRRADRRHCLVVGALAPPRCAMKEIDAFLDHLALERGLSPRTLDAYRRDLAGCFAFLGERGVQRPGDVGAAELRSYVYHLKDRGLQATSIRRALSALRTFYAWAVGEGIAVMDPTEHVELPRTWRRLPHALAREEVERLLEAPDPA